MTATKPSAASALTASNSGAPTQAGLVLVTLISLLIVNLLSFYFNQLYAILGTLGQAALLGVALLYRWRFLQNPDGKSVGLQQHDRRNLILFYEYFQSES